MSGGGFFGDTSLTGALLGNQRDPVSRTSVSTPLNPITQQILQAAQPAIQDFATNPPVPFAGDRVAGFTPLQQQGQQAGAEAATGAVQQASDASLNALQFLLGPGVNPLTNPALQASIGAATQPIFDQLVNQVLPSVRGGAVTSGQFGGSRQALSEGLAIEAANRVAGETAAGLASQGFQSSLDAASRALAFAPSIGLQQIEPARILESIGFTQQQQQQAQLNAEIQRFIEEQTFPFTAASEAARLALAIPGTESTTTATFRPQRSLLERFGAGGLASGARSLGGFTFPGAIAIGATGAG